MLIDLYFLTSLLETSPQRIVRELSYPFAASAVMGASIVALQRSLEFESSLIEFGSMVALGMVVYAGIVLVLERYLSWGLEPTFRKVYAAVLQ